MSYDNWKTTDPADLNPYNFEPEEEPEGDLDFDWDSEDPDDPGPTEPPPLINPGGSGPPANPGPLTSDPDESVGRGGDSSDVPGDYLT
jgi:hypothetical protein